VSLALRDEGKESHHSYPPLIAGVSGQESGTVIYRESDMDQSEVQKLALALPEVAETPHFNRTSFRVGGKIFATAIPNEPFLNIMLGETAREPALVMYSDCVERLLWGNKVLGVTVDLREAEPALVAELLEQAWKEKAPKSLLTDLGL
jgi:hypothetical protein